MFQDSGGPTSGAGQSLGAVVPTLAFYLGSTIYQHGRSISPFAVSAAPTLSEGGEDTPLAGCHFLRVASLDRSPQSGLVTNDTPSEHSRRLSQLKAYLCGTVGSLV